MIEKQAGLLARIGKRLRWRANRRSDTLNKLSQAIWMPRQDGRIDAIREAYAAYISALYPVDKRKVGRAA